MNNFILEKESFLEYYPAYASKTAMFFFKNSDAFNNLALKYEGDEIADISAFFQVIFDTEHLAMMLFGFVYAAYIANGDTVKIKKCRRDQRLATPIALSILKENRLVPFDGQHYEKIPEIFGTVLSRIFNNKTEVVDYLLRHLREKKRLFTSYQEALRIKEKQENFDDIRTIAVLYLEILRAQITDIEVFIHSITAKTETKARTITADGSTLH